MEKSVPDPLTLLTPVCRTILELLSGQPLSAAPLLLSLSGDDWPLFVETCRKQLVAPLVWQRIAEQGLSPNIPGHLLDSLKQSYLSSEARSAFLFSKLDKITASLSRAGIPAALLKGAHLGRYVYRNPALRPMADIDLLVRPGDMSRALKALHELGYGDGRPVPFDLMRNYHHHAPSLGDGSGIFVELHWHIVPPNQRFLLAPEDLWTDALSIDTNEASGVYLLAPETAFLSLCVHAAWQHRFSLNSMLSLADMDRLIRDTRPGINWEALVEKASRWKIERSAYLGLRLIRRLLRTPVPDKAIASIRPADDSRHIEALAETLLCQPPSGIALSDRTPDLLDTASLPKALRTAFRIVFPPKVQFSYLYGIDPSYANLLIYYPKWFGDLCRRYGKTLWNLMRNDKVTGEALKIKQKQRILSAWLENRESQ